MRNRREVLELAPLAILASVAGALIRCQPAEAAALGADFRSFTPREGALLNRLGEALVPGAAAAGFAHFIDHHISVPAAESLLVLRYLDVAPPYADFYRPALTSLQRIAGNARSEAEWREPIGLLQKPSLLDWQGPPPGLFYFAARSDAVDLVYGTRAGFARLGIDYAAHIEPGSDW